MPEALLLLKSLVMVEKLEKVEEVEVRPDLLHQLMECFAQPKNRCLLGRHLGPIDEAFP